MPTVEESIARIAERIEHIGKTADAMRKEMTDGFDDVARNYVRKEEFTPVKSVVYGLVGIMALAVLGAVLKLIII